MRLGPGHLIVLKSLLEQDVECENLSTISHGTTEITSFRRKMILRKDPTWITGLDVCTHGCSGS